MRITEIRKVLVKQILFAYQTLFQQPWIAVYLTSYKLETFPFNRRYFYFCSKQTLIFIYTNVLFFKMLCYSVFKGRRSCSGVFCKKVFLKISQNSPENICVGVSFFINFIKKETSTQVFPFVSCEKFSNTFFIEHVWRVLLKSVCFKCFSTEVLPSKASIISCDSWL